MPREVLFGVPAAMVFIWFNAIVLRTIHHWYGVGWTFDALWPSTLAQTALSIDAEYEPARQLLLRLGGGIRN